MYLDLCRRLASNLWFSATINGAPGAIGGTPCPLPPKKKPIKPQKGFCQWNWGRKPAWNVK